MGILLYEPGSPVNAGVTVSYATLAFFNSFSFVLKVRSPIYFGFEY